MERRPRRWGLWALVGLAAVAGILAVWKLPSVLYGDVTEASADARLQAASSFRTAFVAGLAGLAALASLAMARRTYRLTEQGHITDRYTKAIEQLGNDKLDVRLGGIYALERIAVDSPRDHPTVVEVLGAFVREHSDPGEEKVGHDIPGTDVRAAVTVLGRLPRRYAVSRGDLGEAYLPGVDLHHADLWSANLWGAVLEDADLRWANLSEATLGPATLTRAHLRLTRLEGVDLTDVRGLTQQQLDEAQLDAKTVLPPELRESTSSDVREPDAE